MQELAKTPRPAAVFDYALAGRFFSAHFPDAETAHAADRHLSVLRASRLANHDDIDPVSPSLRLFKGRWEIEAGLRPCFVSNEAGVEVSFYSSKDSYFVRLGDSTVAAGPGPHVMLALSEELDSGSFLFERVLTYGLAAALRRAGAFELHCAAVTDPATSVSALIVGPSGSGKSTLALQLAESGWKFSSDDVVLLTVSDNLIEAFGLRNHFALTDETMARSELAGLDSVLSGRRVGTDNKLSLPPEDFFPNQHVAKCVPELLIFAQRTEAPCSRFEELDQTQAMKRLLSMCPWTCLDLPMAQQFLDVLGRLSRQCRALVLYSGTDLLGDRQYTTRFLSSIMKQQAA